eukprot:112784_1
MKVCSVCTKPNAEIQCKECKRIMCTDCDSAIHKNDMADHSRNFLDGRQRKSVEAPTKQMLKRYLGKQRLHSKLFFCIGHGEFAFCLVILFEALVFLLFLEGLLFEMLPITLTGGIAGVVTILGMIVFGSSESSLVRLFSLTLVVQIFLELGGAGYYLYLMFWSKVKVDLAAIAVDTKWPLTEMPIQITNGDVNMLGLLQCAIWALLLTHFSLVVRRTRFIRELSEEFDDYKRQKDLKRRVSLTLQGHNVEFVDA